MCYNTQIQTFSKTKHILNSKGKKILTVNTGSTIHHIHYLVISNRGWRSTEVIPKICKKSKIWEWWRLLNVIWEAVLDGVILVYGDWKLGVVRSISDRLFFSFLVIFLSFSDKNYSEKIFKRKIKRARKNLTRKIWIFFKKQT